MDAAEATVVLIRARQGDGEAFRTLVERHSASLFRLAYRITGNEQDAEDVVQESFLRAYRQMDRFEARANFKTWIYRIVTNCALDLMRSRRSRREQLHEQPGEDENNAAVAGGPTPERLATSAEINARVRAALGGLTELERAAFVLRHYEGRSIHDIGRALGLRSSAAKHSVFRAVRKLRIALQPWRE